MLFIDTDDNILLTRGDTATFNISITDSEGSPYTMQEGDSLKFSIKRIYEQPEVLLEKVVTEPVVTLDSADTDSLSFGVYHYDVVFINDTKVDTIIADKTFTVGYEVHDLGGD